MTWIHASSPAATLARITVTWGWLREVWGIACDSTKIRGGVQILIMKVPSAEKDMRIWKVRNGRIVLLLRTRRFVRGEKNGEISNLFTTTKNSVHAPQHSMKHHHRSAFVATTHTDAENIPYSLLHPRSTHIPLILPRRGCTSWSARPFQSSTIP